MQTQLVKIVSDQEGWVEWCSRQIRENPGKSAAVALFAVPFIAAEVPVALASGMLIAGGGLAYDWSTGSDRIEQIPMSKAVALRDRDDNPPEIDRIYARHPLRKIFPNTVLAADRFHSHMIADQMADIACFLRAHVLLRKLRITVSSANGAKLDGAVTNGTKNLGIKAHFNSVVHHELILHESHPVLVPYEIEPYWIDQFPEIKASIQQSNKGSITRTIGMDNTYGLTASVAAQAGINIDWLSKQLFRIEASYG